MPLFLCVTFTVWNKKLAMMTIHKIAVAKFNQQGTECLIYIDVSTSARLTTSLRITRV